MKTNPEAKQRQGFDPGRAAGPVQVGAVENLLEDLRVHLDAGDAFAERRGLEVEQAESGDADQDQLALEQFRRHLAREQVGGRDEAPRIVRAEIDVEGAVGLQGHRDVAQPELDALAAVIFDAQRRRVRGDAQHFERQRRNDDLADARHEGHAPHDAVGHVGAQQPASCGRLVDLRPALQVAVVLAQRQVPRLLMRTGAACGGNG